MILELVNSKFWHSREVICDLEKPEVIWDLVGETFEFIQWCLLLMLVHLSLGHRFLMSLGEWVLLPIVVLVAGSLVHVIISLRFSLLTNEMNWGMCIPIPETIQRDVQGVDPFLNFIYLFIHSFNLSTVSSAQLSFHAFTHLFFPSLYSFFRDSHMSWIQYYPGR